MLERRRRVPEGPSFAVLLAVGVYVLCLLVVPLGALVWQVVQHSGEVLAALRSPDALRALGLSVAVAAASVILNGVFGLAGAVVLTRHRFLGRRLLDALVDLPLALSPVMTGLAFLLLFGRSGLLRPALDVLDLQVAFAWPGVLIATLFVTLPFTLREVALVLEEQGDSEEQAAATLGATPWQAFWLVTLPNVRKGLVLGTTLTLARALGEFGAVLVLGGGIANKTQTATTFIHATVEERQEPAAFGMALVLAAAAVLLLGLLERRRRPV